jgi:hypothetical protein
MGKMPLIVMGTSLVLAASGALGQDDPSAESTVRSGGMLMKLLKGEARMGRNGVPADATHEARAIVEQPYIPRQVYITDEYGFNYDRRGDRIR